MKMNVDTLLLQLLFSNSFAQIIFTQYPVNNSSAIISSVKDTYIDTDSHDNRLIKIVAVLLLQDFKKIVTGKVPISNLYHLYDYVVLDNEAKKNHQENTNMLADKTKDTSATILIPSNKKGNIYYKLNGCFSNNAENFTKAINTPKKSLGQNNIRWHVIQNIGKSSSGISSFPVSADSLSIAASTPSLQYEIYTYDTVAVKLNTYFSASLDFHKTYGLKCTVAINDE